MLFGGLTGEEVSGEGEIGRSFGEIGGIGTLRVITWWWDIKGGVYDQEG